MTQWRVKSLRLRSPFSTLRVIPPPMDRELKKHIEVAARSSRPVDPLDEIALVDESVQRIRPYIEINPNRRRRESRCEAWCGGGSQGFRRRSRRS